MLRYCNSDVWRAENSVSDALEENMRGTRAVHSNGTNTAVSQTDRRLTALKGTTHCPPQNHKSQQNQVRPRPSCTSTGVLTSTPSTAGWTKTKITAWKKATERQKKKKKRSTVLHIASHKLTFNRLFSPRTDRMETRSISRTLKCSPEDGEENHLFSIYVIYIKNSHNNSHTVRVIGVNKTVQTQLSESTQ